MTSHRDAITGEFVTAEHAEANPDTTVSESPCTASFGTPTGQNPSPETPQQPLWRPKHLTRQIPRPTRRRPLQSRTTPKEPDP